MSKTEISDYPPPGMEVRLLSRYASPVGKHVLEIGCGDGRLTREYAHLAASVVAIEPDSEAIATARRLAAGESGMKNVDFRVASAERLRLPEAPFDLVLFSWSL